MNIDINGFLFVVAIVALVALFAVVVVLMRDKRRVARVDNYAISIEEHDGFPFLHLKLEADGAFRTFELDPSFGHVLSDQLLTASARALAGRGSHGVEAH